MFIILYSFILNHFEFSPNVLFSVVSIDSILLIQLCSLLQKQEEIILLLLYSVASKKFMTQ